MSDPVEKDMTDSVKRILALKQITDEAERQLELAKDQVKLRRAVHKKAQITLSRAIDEEGKPSLFSEGVVVSEGDLEAAHEEIDRQDEE